MMHYGHNSRSTNYKTARDAVLSKSLKYELWRGSRCTTDPQFPKHKLWSGSRCTTVKIPEARIM